MWTTGEHRQPSLININTITSRNLMEMLRGLSDMKEEVKHNLF
jgi:hypothetical protein